MEVGCINIAQAVRTRFATLDTESQSLRLFSGEPVSWPHANLFNVLHASDTGSQVGASETTVSGLIGQAAEVRGSFGTQAISELA